MKEDDEFRVMEKQARGEQAGALGDWDTAVRMYTYGLYTNPDRLDLVLGRAAAFFAVHRFEDAREDAATACELDPTCELAYFQEAQALIEMDRVSEAMLTVTRGLQRSATTSLLHPLHRLLTEELTADRGTSPSVQQLFDTLKNWLYAAGATFPKLKLKCYRLDDRGVHSSTFIPVPSTLREGKKSCSYRSLT